MLVQEDMSAVNYANVTPVKVLPTAMAVIGIQYGQPMKRVLPGNGLSDMGTSGITGLQSGPMEYVSTGAIGLQYAMNHSDKVKAVALMEPQALYPNQAWSDFSPPEAHGLFRTLRDPEKGWPFMRDNSVFIEGMTNTIISRTITPEEHAFYREPFLRHEERKPMWSFPNQIPIEGTPPEVAEAVETRNKWFTGSDIPKLLFHASPGCTVREPQLQWCREHLSNLGLVDIGEGFHHLMEENPHAIGRELQRWLGEIETRERTAT